jgi:hypothetical protein
MTEASESACEEEPCDEEQEVRSVPADAVSVGMTGAESVQDDLLEDFNSTAYVYANHNDSDVRLNTGAPGVLHNSVTGHDLPPRQQAPHNGTECDPTALEREVERAPEDGFKEPGSTSGTTSFVHVAEKRRKARSAWFCSMHKPPDAEQARNKKCEEASFAMYPPTHTLYLQVEFNVCITQFSSLTYALV